MQLLKAFLTHPAVLGGWILLVAFSVLVLMRDLRQRNPQTAGLMRWVWILTVLYSGPIGLGIYYYSGRRQIAQDSLWRRGFRSVAHCYSGCGAGEIVGVIIAVGLLSLGNLWVAIITFLLAYIAGFALTIGPLMQEGVGFRKALSDAFLSESASITVMELVAIGVDLWLAGGSKINEPLFWSALVVSLSLGLLAAYPVNVWLISRGVKEGMHHPAHAHH